MIAQTKLLTEIMGSSHYETFDERQADGSMLRRATDDKLRPSSGTGPRISKIEFMPTISFSANGFRAIVASSWIMPCGFAAWLRPHGRLLATDIAQISLVDEA